MKKFITILFLAILSQQALAVTTTTVAGIDFEGIANSVSASVGSFNTNDVTQTNAVDTAVDGNAASFMWGLSNPSTLDASFSSAADVANVNLTLLFVGTDPHTGSVSLFGGTGGTSSAVDFSLTPYDGSTFTGYTGFNSVTTTTPPAEQPGAPSTTTLGIFSLTLNLADTFGSGFGTFSGVQLNIYDGASGSYNSALSLVGTTAVVPVPAAVWLFGSGLLGLAGVARRKK